MVLKAQSRWMNMHSSSENDKKITDIKTYLETGGDDTNFIKSIIYGDSHNFHRWFIKEIGDSFVLFRNVLYNGAEYSTNENYHVFSNGDILVNRYTKLDKACVRVADAETYDTIIQKINDK